MPTTNTKKLSRKKQEIIRLFQANQVDEAYRNLERLLETHQHDYELRYLAGMIESSRYQYVQALSNFGRALQLNPRHEHSLFEIGLIECKLCRFNKAKFYLQKAKKLGGATKDCKTILAQIQREAQSKDVTLSACLIVKNEEKHLPKCLKSIQAIADEIIVVDTGSEDHTVKIAEGFGAKVYHFEWRNDFAAARNFANAQASSQWILQMDADEELFPEDQHKVREVIHQGECNGAYLALHNRVSSTFGEILPSVHYLVRLFRNLKDFCFESPVHEVLKISGKVIAVDIRLLHHGYNLDPNYLREKRKRNQAILKKRLQENPDNPMTLFYLSMMHMGEREYDAAEEFAHRALEQLDRESARYQHIYLMLLNNLALINLDRQEHGAVVRYCREAIHTNENYLDPYYFLGVTHLRQDQLHEAKEVFEEYLAVEARQAESPVFNLFGSSAQGYLFQVYHNLGKIHRKQKAYALARELFLKATQINPQFWLGFADLGYLHIDLQDWRSAAEFLDKAINLAKKNPDVSEKNEALWFDFTNAVKHYVILLKKLRSEKALARTEAITA